MSPLIAELASRPSTKGRVESIWKHLSMSKQCLALSALSTANPATVLEKPAAILKDTQTFNVAIPFEGAPITNQRSSGRCWIFAATNVFRVAIMKKYDIEKC